ncbi:MAG TPA: hypothetical protein VGL75_02615 [Acidothermaceae bacterium]|jgi:hypothetical protein
MTAKPEPGVFMWKGSTIRTIGELTDAVATITSREEGVEFMAAYFAVNVHAAENVGYVAGYHDAETRHRIHEFTDTAHPIFGRGDPTPEEAFDAGRRVVEQDRWK